MKKTVENLNKGLAFLTESKIESLDFKIKELKESYIDETIKAFNVDLSNKIAHQTISNFIVAVEFSNSMKNDVKKIKDKVSTDEDTEYLNYILEVEAIANRMLNGAQSPITMHTKEMQKALMIDNINTFNAHMKALFNVELNTKQIEVLKYMLITSKRSGLDVMSNNQFKNLIMHIFTRRLIASGSFSPKKVRGALKKAIKDVPTISYEEALTLNEATVCEYIEVLGLAKRYEGDNYNYAEMKEKVVNALHKKIAVLPAKNETE